MLKLKLKTNL